jgi:tetratricopeptide (TPR) repeat protein
LPDGDRRWETELELLIALGQTAIASRGWGAPELDEVHSRARELALTLNRPRALLFPLLGQFRDHWARADLKGAQRFAAELRELGETTGDVPTQVLSRHASWYALFQLGEFTASRSYLEKALALYDPAHRSSYAELLPYDAGVMLRTNSSWLLACLGHLDQALLQRDAALDEARRLSDPRTLVHALGLAAWMTGSFVRLEPRSLLQCADEMLALATERGLGLYEMGALVRRGSSLVALRRADEGISLLTTGVVGWQRLGFTVNTPWILTLFGEACQMAGQWQTALGHVAKARRLAEETGDRWFQAETVRLTGDVLLTMDDPGAAEASYHEAIAIAQLQSAKLWELRAATSLARLWQGKRSEARDLLAPVYGWFTEGFGTPDIKEAKALLEELT